MIFLSKNGQDEYINMFARACGTEPISTENFIYKKSKEPIMLRGILKYKIMKQCWEDGRDFYYVDTGYFGNEQNITNPNGWKLWHRVVKNNLQHTTVIPRSNDRFSKFSKKFQAWKKFGKKILIAAPDEKPCKFYGTTQEKWLKETIETIKKYTDRPIEIRQRSKKRFDRLITNTLQSALDNDVYALVTFNSIAAVESIFHGIPVFTLAPANAAAPVGLQDLSRIEKPYYPEEDKLQLWANHLAYGQFHVNEIKNGTAYRFLINENS